MSDSGSNPTLVPRLQGVYYAVTGIWPLVHMRSFEWITGKKTDDWLVRCIGAMLAVQGAVLYASARRNQVPAALRNVGAGTAAVLGTVDIVYYRRGTLRWVYLLDALAEGGIVLGWLFTLPRPGARFRGTHPAPTTPATP